MNEWLLKNTIGLPIEFANAFESSRLLVWAPIIGFVSLGDELTAIFGR